MNDKSSLKTYFKFFLYSSIIFFFSSIFFKSTKAALADAKTRVELVDLSSAYNTKAWYSIQLGNIPVGSLVVGVDDLKTGYPSDYNVQFISRVGASPFLSFIRGNFNKNNDNHIELKQKLSSKNEGGIFQESENKWQEKENTLVLTNNNGATLQGLFPLDLTSHELSGKITPSMNLFYYKLSSSVDKILVPFTGTSATASFLHLTYDDDRFLHSADLPIKENISLSFKRISEAEYRNFIKSSSVTLIDLGWLSSIQSPKSETDSLSGALNACINQAGAMNKLVIRNIPQSSYLSYRKLINISRFCMDTNNLLKKSKNYNEKLYILSYQIKKLMKEDRLELPASISNSPDLTIFYNDTVSFLWPKVTQVFVHSSLEEIANNFNLEKNRKSLLAIQVNIASLQPRSVVRADIKVIEPSIVFSIMKSNTPGMNEDSLVSNVYSSQENKNSYLVNGQYFAKYPNIDLNLLCEKNKGKFGIDLGDAPQIIVNSGGVRGIWDAMTRVSVAREFALKTASTKSCQQIVFRVPEKIIPDLKNELEDFKNSVLSPDNEILLSNNIPKKLLVMPGRYKITTTSLVTGALISTHEFNVDAGTNTIVTARAN